MSAVGYVLLYWGLLEVASKAAERGDIPPDLRRVRNLLAHGLIGANARPEDGAAPFVICRGLDGGPEVALTLAHLEDVAQAIDRLRLEMEAEVRLAARPPR